MNEELLRLKEENLLLKEENEGLRQENMRLAAEIKACYDDINNQINMLSSVKTEMRRYEVQLTALKSQNSELKYKFARIENNPIGKILFKIYRNLRELKHRYIDRKV